jgi:hypothetical protein
MSGIVLRSFRLFGVRFAIGLFHWARICSQETFSKHAITSGLICFFVLTISLYPLKCLIFNFVRFSLQTHFSSI